ncbi:MAG: transposase [Bacteroidota bacterium]
MVELGWQYVLRTGGNQLVQTEVGEQVRSGTMVPEARQKFFMLYDVAFTKKRYGPVNLLIYHHPKHKDPLYILSQLDFPEAIARLYKKRFKIETFFSDQKSRGFNIHRSKLGHPKRLAKLLIATCLTYIFCIIVRG